MSQHVTVVTRPKSNTCLYHIYNKGDFCLIGQFSLRLSLINFTSGSGRLEKADEDLKKKTRSTSLTKSAITVRNYLCCF